MEKTDSILKSRELTKFTNLKLSEKYEAGGGNIFVSRNKTKQFDMSLFNKLFSRKNRTTKMDERNFSGVYIKDSFNERFTEEKLDAETLDGCFKMIESYFIENKIKRKIESPINHPVNLDQIDQEGFGFIMYCKAYGLGDAEATLFLALSFSDFLINKYGFKLYKDTKPEFQLRSMTLKYNKNDVVLSLYPFEYVTKVLTGNQTFSEMDKKLNSQLSEIPTKDELIDKFINFKEDQ
ncbi:hypothetical protein JXM83_02465 [Candidatus Woesearchaeota archaeon]|nr:hypothetical protein [Candidatus Woesearchaeota archaeon]